MITELLRRVSLLCVVLACTLFARAATLPDTLVLSGDNWHHAVAVAAQTQAMELGIGRSTDSFVPGFVLSDLNDIYDGKARWAEIYPVYQALDNKSSGSVAELRNTLPEKTVPGVLRQLAVYLDGQKVSTATPVVADSAATPAVNTPPATTPLPDIDEPASTATGKPVGLYLLLLLSLLLAIGALAAAWLQHRQLLRLRDQNEARLKQLADTIEQLAGEASTQVNALQRRVNQIETARHLTEPRTVSHTRDNTPAAPSGAPKHEQVIFLGKPDDDDNFTRPSSIFEPGNSIYRLTTIDGVRGTFAIVDNRDVHRFALMMPTENLTRACSGNAIQMAAGMSRIVTDRPGEALYENGRWRVIIKAIIHYES